MFPYLTSEILDRLDKGKKVKVLDESGEWYKIGFDDKTGWIYGQYLTIIGEPVSTGMVNASEVNMRVNPSDTSEVIMMLEDGTEVSVYGISGEWYLVETSEKEFGWIHRTLLDVRESDVSRGINDEEHFFREIDLTEITTLQTQVVEYAKKFLGVKYVWGGESPKGFDCSGLVLYVYRHFGVRLPHLASLQTRYGTYVKRSELCAGDLVFFDTGGDNDIGHVGIYAGDGMFVHASSSNSNGHKVVCSSLDGYYSRVYVTARRIFN
jgi:N-acetylmuramoyl-L-alanine amidase